MAITLPKYTGTRASQISQYESWFDSQFPGVISNASAPANDGLTWGGYYSKVASSPLAAPYSPYTLAEGVLGEIQIGDAPSAIAKAVTAGGTALGDTATGVVAGAESLYPSWSSGLTSFLSFIGSRGGWIRIAEGVIGGLLILAAVSTLAAGTPAGKIAAKAALL